MLQERIKQDMTDALKAGDKQKVTCLRVLLTAIKNREKNIRKELSDEEVQAVLRTEIKQVADSYEQFSQAQRADLAEREQVNLQVLKAYLPAEMSDDELTALIDACIAEQQATKKDFGKIMKLVMAKVAGKADGKRISAIVNARLAG